MHSTVFSAEEFLKILEDFPVLKREVNGKRLVYLDNAASTLKSKSVIEKMTDFYLYHYSNIHRAVHTLATEATVAYEQAREKIAKFLNSNTEEVIFTSGTTMGINFLVNSLVRSGMLNSEDTVLLSQVEHHANLVPWVRLQFIGVKTSSEYTLTWSFSRTRFSFLVVIWIFFLVPSGSSTSTSFCIGWGPANSKVGR